MTLEFNHFGIKCTDFQASVKYYTEVLGLEKLYELEVLGKSCVFVGNGTIEIELEDAGANTPPPAAPPAAGLTHFAFMVKDIDKLAQELKDRGAQFMFPPFNIRPTRKIAFIKAPDSVLIQLIEDFPEAG
jgi:catechol 2,3-dioxygenase-like lactoylglutathione lyase family enzyme